MVDFERLANLASSLKWAGAIELGRQIGAQGILRKHAVSGRRYPKQWRPNTNAKPAPGFLAAVSMGEGGR